MDKLGIPDDYEDNNGGYISNEDGYYWQLMYPSYDFNTYEIRFVMKSLEGYEDHTTTHKEDSIITTVHLVDCLTSRGIKQGSSISDIATAYGRPTDITDNALGFEISYQFENQYLCFQIDSVTGEVLYVFWNYDISSSFS